MPPAPFLTRLLVLFVMVTALWVRVERRHRHLQPVRRFGRVGGGLLAAVIVLPIAVLMPVFWLAEKIPVEAGLHARRGAIMVVLLAALALTVLVNVVGGIVIALRAALARTRA